jgi:uncharacterized coiled-coil protein SlyX
MKTILISMMMFFLFYSSGFAQTVEERIKILEEALKKQEETIKAQQKLIEDLKAEMKQVKPPEQKEVAQPKEAEAPAATPGQAVTAQQVQQQVQQLDEKVNEVVEALKKNVLSVFNPAIGLVGESIPSYRSKGSKETGSDRPGGFDFFQRSVELNLAGSVDPFARGYAVINASADPITGDATATVEEAALQTTSLPWNLTLKAGRFFGEFGRLSYIHDHELPFVNRPLVLDKYVGGESKTDGVQLNYLLPISHYVSLTAGVGDQFGDTPNNVGDFRHFSELNFWGRSSTYFDLTPDVSLETGLSGLFNPKTEGRGAPVVQPDGSTLTESRRLFVGGDLLLRYQPLRNNQFRSLTWGTELLYSDSRYLVNPGKKGRAGLSDLINSAKPASAEFNASVGSFGLYSYLAYKLHRQWTVGFLYDWMENPQNHFDKTSAYSPYITWAISHWNQLRLQYTYTTHNAVSGLKDDNAIYLQWAWIIGSHSHGWQER